MSTEIYQWDRDLATVRAGMDDEDGEKDDGPGWMGEPIGSIHCNTFLLLSRRKRQKANDKRQNSKKK